MKVKYFISDDLIPNDGSKEIINTFSNKIEDETAELFFFPDVHYKKGSRVVNGMLFASNQYILPAMLGVANCGFSFGKVKSNDFDKIKNAFENYSKLLKDYQAFENYTWDEIETMFKKYLEKDFKNNKELYDFCGVKTFDDAFKKFKSILNKNLKKVAIKTLCSLGGGNHFFEIHKIVDLNNENKDFKKDEFVFMLHSDSIAFGSGIFDLYSNLSEWGGGNALTKSIKKRMRKFRKKQFMYFLKRGLFFKSPKELMKLLCNKEDYRLIKLNSAIGKDLIFAHNVASLFGEMNRDLILQNFSKTQNIEFELMYSHNHDSIGIENGKNIQRNGVQNIKNDKYSILPSAMGSYSYIMENNLNNKETYCSSNHGCGRLKDKHIARDNFTQNDTEKDLLNSNVYLYRVGPGNIAEQNNKAFKDAKLVLDEMEKYKMGVWAAKTQPSFIIKG